MRKSTINIINALGELQCDPYPLENLKDALNDIEVFNYRILKTKIDQKNMSVEIIVERK